MNPVIESRGKVTFGLAGLTGQTLDATPEGYGSELRALIRYGQLAETEGFTAIWTCEHHFAIDGYMPTPFAVLGALSTATDRATIGTNIMLPALWDPLRLAEQAASVDQLCGGRLVLGFGLGYRDDEFEALGWRRRNRVGRTVACIDVLRRAWRQEPIYGHGLQPQSKSIVVSPLPAQRGGPPIWLGGFVERAVRRSREIADGYISPWITLKGLQRRIDWLREAGSIDEFDFTLSLAAFVAKEDAWDCARRGIDHVEAQHRRWMTESNDFPQLSDQAWDATGPPDHMVVGPPELCAARLRPWFDSLTKLAAEARSVHVAVRLTFPGISERENAESIRLFAREVVPSLRENAVQVHVADADRGPS